MNKCKKILLPQRATRIRAVFHDYWSTTELDPAFKLIDRQYQPVNRRLGHANNLKIITEYPKMTINSNYTLLPRWLGLIISCFIPEKKNRERFRAKYVKERQQ